jgi:hypothetical protein
MIILSKFIAIFLAFLVITKTYYDLRKKQESLVMFLFWTTTWLFIAYVALKPGLFYKLFNSMASENIGMGTFFGIAFIFLFFVIYRVYTKANRLERKIRDITTKIALKDIDDKV